MKVSSIHDSAEFAPAQLGKDIGKPGIYKSTRGVNDNERLIVTNGANKFYWLPGSGALRLQIASASLEYRWIPVKEKITVTFDNTEE